MQNKTKYIVTALAASSAFFAALEQREGFSAKPYHDSGKVVTQGIGSTTKPDGTKIKINDAPITRKVAYEWAASHVAKDEVIFRKSLQGVRLSQAEYDVYLDFMYNFGQANWSKSSMLRNLNAGQYVQACQSLLQWKYVAKKDCSIRKNNCYGVWTRQLDRYNKCIGANT